MHIAHKNAKYFVNLASCDLIGWLYAASRHSGFNQSNFTKYHVKFLQVSIFPTLLYFLCISGKPAPKWHVKMKQAVVGHFTCQSDSCFLSKWAYLGQRKLQSRLAFMLIVKRKQDHVLILMNSSLHSCCRMSHINTCIHRTTRETHSCMLM